MAQYNAPSLVALNERLSALQGSWQPDETRVFIADVIGYRSEALRVASAPIASLTAQYKGDDLEGAIQGAHEAIMFARQYAVQSTKLIQRAMGQLRHHWEYRFPETLEYNGKEKKLQAVYHDTAWYVSPECYHSELFTVETLDNLERVQREISTEARIRLEIAELEAQQKNVIPE